MAKTIAELRQQLTDISKELVRRQHDDSLSEHDRNNLRHAEVNVDVARNSLFNCGSQA